MRQIIHLVAAAALLSPLAARPAAAQETNGDRFTWSGAIPDGNWIRIRNTNGRVEVLPSTSGKVEVVAVKHWRRGDPQDVHFEVKKGGSGDNDVSICALWFDSSCDDEGNSHGGRGEHHNSDVSVDFTISVPKGVRVDVSTVNGGVSVRGAGSEVIAETVNGGVDVETTGGPVHAQTVNGGITARMATLPGNEDLNYETVNGGIRLYFPESLDATLDLSTVNGDVTTDFPLTVSGRFDKHHIRGTVGKGGRRIRAETVNGGITIEKS